MWLAFRDVVGDTDDVDQEHSVGERVATVENLVDGANGALVVDGRAGAFEIVGCVPASSEDFEGVVARGVGNVVGEDEGCAREASKGS